MVGLLFRVRWRSFTNGLTRALPSDRRRARAAVAWMPIVAAVTGWFAIEMLDPLLSSRHTFATAGVLAVRLPGFLLFSAFWMLVLSAVTMSIQSLYLSQDVSLLLASPIPVRSIYTAKLVDITFSNALFFVCLGGPILAAYVHLCGGLTFVRVLELVISLAAFSVLPTSIGVLATMLLMRALPAGRSRDVLAALGVAVFAGCYFALSVWVRRMHDYGALTSTIEGMARAASHPLFSVGPWAWAGAVVSDAVAPTNRLRSVLFLVLSAASAAALGALAAERMHWRGWTATQEAHTRSSTGRSAAWHRTGIWRPGPIRAVLLKDLRCLWRDMRQLSMLFLPAAVMAVFMVNVPGRSETGAAPPAVVMLTLYPVLGMVALRLALSAFVTESRALWVASAAPVEAMSVLIGKLAYALALALPAALVATAVYTGIRGATPAEWIGLMALAPLAAVAFCGIGVGVSAMFMDPEAHGPRSVVPGGARLLVIGLQFAYLVAVVTVGLLAWYAESTGYAPEAAAYGVAYLLAAALSAIAAWGPMRAGARRLQRIEW